MNKFCRENRHKQTTVYELEKKEKILMLFINVDMVYRDSFDTNFNQFVIKLLYILPC